MTSKTGEAQVQRVIITGANGYLGQRLVTLLKQKAVKVLALGSRQELMSLLENDSKDFLIEDGSHVAVIHLAGKSHAGDCQNNPRSAFEANVHLTFQLLEFCRKHHIKKFIFPSTGFVYGETKMHPVTEDAPTHPSDVYSATKLAAEALIQGYAESYHLETIIVRLSNVYGPEGNPDTVTQIILRQIKNANDAIVFRTGLPVRDFIFIDDVIQAFYRLLFSMPDNNLSILNVSTGIGSSVSLFAETACKIAGISPKKIQILDGMKQHDSSLILDNSRLKSTTGWNTMFSLSDGLTKILKE